MAERKDLSETTQFYRRLLTGPHRWRQRLEVDVVCASAGHIRATSRFLVDFEESIFDDYFHPPNVDRVNVLLPLSTRAKAPLLNPTFSGPFGPAHVSLRSVTSYMQSEYLAELAEDSSNAATVTDGLPLTLLRGICEFSPDSYREHAAVTTRADAVRRYLEERKRQPLPGVTTPAIDGWLRDLESAREILVTHLDEPPDDYSSSENPLLALAHVEGIQTSTDIDRIVGGYCSAVEAADDAEDDELLTGLAEYGRRYELVLEVELPAQGPATVTVSEDVEIQLRDGWFGYWFPAAAARTVHVDVRVTDPAVAVAQHRLLDPHGNPVDKGDFDSLRRIGSEVVSFYSSVPDRPEPMQLRLRLRAATDLLVAAMGLAVLNTCAFAGLFVLRKDGIAVDEVAVLVVPTTLAATFALFREQSTLATRLLAVWRGFIALTIVLLLAAAFYVLASRPESDGEDGAVRPKRGLECQPRCPRPPESQAACSGATRARTHAACA